MTLSPTLTSLLFAGQSWGWATEQVTVGGTSAVSKLTLSTKLALSSLVEMSVKLNRVVAESATTEKVWSDQLMLVEGARGVSVLSSKVVAPVSFTFMVAAGGVWLERADVKR